MKSIKSLSVNTKPTLFIASSTEGLKVAKKVKKALDRYAQITLWNEDVFLLNESYLNSLLNFSAFYDFAVMIFTADDQVKIRKATYQAPRDNVVFEYGLFLGRIGPTRAFVLYQEKIRIFSDYDGITALPFSTKNHTLLARAYERIKEKLLSFKKDFIISLLPSTVLAIGYYKNFIEKVVDALLEKKPMKIVVNVGKRTIERPIRYDQFSIKILLPNRLNELNPTTYKKKTRSFRRITLDTSFRSFPFYIEGRLPSNGRKLELFDVPTTLLSSLWTIESLFDHKFLKEKKRFEMLEQREIINFERTLRSEIEDFLEDGTITFSRLKK